MTLELWLDLQIKVEGLLKQCFRMYPDLQKGAFSNITILMKHLHVP